MSLNKKSITVKRILSDIKEIKSTYNPKIFICFDENNIKQIKALIIGPDDTPYEDGFFFLQLIFLINIHFYIQEQNLKLLMVK